MTTRAYSSLYNWKCQNYENEEVHICPFVELEDIETFNELNNERDDNEQYYDKVLETFFEKKDNGNEVADVIAEIFFYKIWKQGSNSCTNRCLIFHEL